MLCLQPIIDKSSNARRLEKMLRILGTMPVGRRYTQVFVDCETDKKRVKILKRLLVEAGMEGT